MPPLADVAAVAALVALILVAYRHPRRRTEVLVSLGASGLALASGLVDVDDAARTLGDLAPVVAFLATILVVADVCDRAGLFTAASRLLRAGPTRLLTVAFLLGAAVTAVLSLDATVVLLTPVVVAAARSTGTATGPGAFACLRMANSASLLLPISNLTNLLALPSLTLGFTGFALRMAPVLAVVLVVEYVGLRLLFRRELHAAAAPTTCSTTSPSPEQPFPVVPAAAVLVMLVVFALGSPLGVAPAWISAATATFLLGWTRWSGRRTGDDVGPPLTDPTTWREVVASAHLEFAVFVLALGVVVAAVSAGGLREHLADLLPDDASGFVPLLVIALLATALASVVTNLSATLLLVPLVAPLGDVAVLAALLGLNIGSGLTLTGSLANLLWRRGLVADDDGDSDGDPRTTGLIAFHRVSLVLTPFSLLAAVATLSLVAGYG